MSDYDNLIKLLTTNSDTQSTSRTGKLSASQQESVQRLVQKPMRESKIVVEQEDPMKECTFHPTITSKSKNYVPKERDAHMRLYEQGKQKIDTLNKKIEEKRRQEEIEAAKQQPTFCPTLVSSSKAKQRVEQDAFSALYNDAMKQKARRDEQAITFASVDTFRPKTHTKPGRTPTIQNIVEQLAKLE